MHVTTRLAFTVQGAAEGSGATHYTRLSQIDGQLSIWADTMIDYATGQVSRSGATVPELQRLWRDFIVDS